MIHLPSGNGDDDDDKEEEIGKESIIMAAALSFLSPCESLSGRAKGKESFLPPSSFRQRIMWHEGGEKQTEGGKQGERERARERESPPLRSISR